MRSHKLQFKQYNLSKSTLLSAGGVAAIAVSFISSVALHAAAVNNSETNAANSDFTSTLSQTDASASAEAQAQNTPKKDKDSSSNNQQSNSQAEVTVNGQTYSAPEGTSLHKTINNNGNQTTIDIQNNSSSSNSGGSYTSVNTYSNSTSTNSGSSSFSNHSESWSQ